MEEAIDLFKYNLYLGKLELIKGKKKPVHDFIKEVYEVSNNLKYHTKNYNNQPETFKYAFMLITKAMTYDGSVKPIKNRIQNQVRSAANSLVTRKLVTAENIESVYEYYEESAIGFYPESIEELYKFEEAIGILGIARFSISYSSLAEFKMLSYSLLQQAARLFLLTNNPDSILAHSIEKDTTKQHKALEQFSQLTHTIQGVLDEHNSTISQTN